MPAGFDRYYPQEAQEPTDFVTQRRLPTRQVDPFIGAVYRMQQSGLITPAAANAYLGPQLRSRSLVEQARVPEGPVFQPGNTNFSETELREIGQMARHQVVGPADSAEFIPRAQTETSGFLRLLDYLQVFNYAIAGAVDAMVNLYQGEDEETNPFVEAWRGFTLKDKETFSDVFENMGWQSEDGFGYWSREVLGFAADVLFDPTTYLTLGSSQVAARVGKYGVSTVLRKGVGTTVLREVGEKVAKEAFEAASEGAASKTLIGAGLDERSHRRLARHLLTRQEEIARKRGVTAAVEGSPDALKALEAVDSLELKESIIQDVMDTFGMLSRHQKPDAWDAVFREVQSDIPKLFDRMGVDPSIATRTMQHLLEREGLEWNFDNLKRFMTSKRAAKSVGLEGPGIGGVQKLLDQGGVKLSLPFTGREAALIKAQWMDTTKLYMADALHKYWGKATGQTAPWLLREPLVLGAKAGAAVVDSLARASYGVQQFFGVNLAKNPWLTKIFKEREQMLGEAGQETAAHTKQMLELPRTDPKTGKKLEPRALEDEEAYAVFDALADEEESFLEWLESGKALDDIEAGEAYKPKHIASIRKNPQLRHLTEEQREELIKIAENVQQHFQDLATRMKREGLDVAWREYYLPHQYEEFANFRRTRIMRRKLEKITDADPFVKARKLKRAEARRPVEQNGLGLTPSRNLFGMVYGRTYSMERARIERMFIGKIMDEFAIHPGQIDKVMNAGFGPGEAFSEQILESVRNKTVGADVWADGSLEELIPEFAELKDYIQKGDYEAGKQWLEDNETLVNQALIEAEDDFYTALDIEVQSNRGIVSTHMSAMENAYSKSVEDLREAIGKTPKELLAKIRQLVGNREEGDLYLAAGIARGLARRLDLPLKAKEAEKLLLTAFDGTPRALQAIKQAGPDAGRMILLEAAIDDVIRKNDSVLTKVDEALGDKLDVIAKDLKAAIYRRLNDAQAVFPDFHEILLGLTVKAIAGEAVETAITKGGAILTNELLNAPVYKRLRLWKEAVDSGNVRRAQMAQDYIFENFALNAELRGHALEWRRARGLPDLPAGELSNDMRAELLEFIVEKSSIGDNYGLQFFGESPFVRLGQTDEVRAPLKRRLERELRIAAEGDEYLMKEFRKLVSEPGSRKAGTHWQPYRSARQLMQSYHNIRGAEFLDNLYKRARKASPEEAAKYVRGQRKQVNWLTGSRVESTMGRLQKDVLETMTSQVQRAVHAAAKNAGVSPDKIDQVVARFDNRIRETLGLRGPDVNLTETKEITTDIISDFHDELKNLWSAPDAVEFLGGTLESFRREMNDVASKIKSMHREAVRIRDEIRLVSGDVEGIIDFTKINSDEVIDAVDGLRSNIQKLIAANEERVRSLLIPLEETPYGAKVLDHVRKDEVLGSVLEVWKDIREDVTSPMRPGAEKAWRKGRLAQAEAQAEAARQNLRKLNTELDKRVPLLQVLQDEARNLDQLEVSRKRLRRQWEAFQAHRISREGGGWAQGFTVEAWFRAAAEDEFVRAGGSTAADWAQVVQKVWESGPTNETLREAWSKLRMDVKDPGQIAEIGEELRRVMSGDPLEGVSAAAYRAARSVGIGGQPITVKEVTEAAAAALEDTPLGSLITMDDGFMADVLRRQQQLMTEDADLARQIQAIASEARLPAEEIAKKSRAIREETAFIQAVEDTVAARIEPLSKIAAEQGHVPETLQPLESFLHKRFVFPGDSAEEAARHSKRMRDLTDQLAEADDATIQRFMMEAIEKSYHEEFLAALEQARRGGGRIPGLRNMVGEWGAKFEETIESAYERMASKIPDIDDTKLAQELTSMGRPRDEKGRFLSQSVVGLGPKRRAFLKAIIGDTKIRKRGNMDISTEVIESMQESVGKHLGDTGFDTMLNGRRNALRGELTEQVELTSDYVEVQAYLEKELEIFEREVIPGMKRDDYARLTYTDKDKPLWRSLRHFDRYLKHQVLRAEREGLENLMFEIPSGQELAFLRARQYLDKPSEEMVQRAAQLRLGGVSTESGMTIGSPMRAEDEAIFMSAMAFDWENAIGGWKNIVTGSTQHILSGHGISLATAGSRRQFLRHLKEKGVNGIYMRENGSMWVEWNEIGFDGISHYEALQLRDAIKEVWEFQDFAASKNMLYAPALPNQVEGIGFALNSITQDPVEQGSILFALTGVSRADQLSVAGAAQALHGLDETFSEIRKYGKRHVAADPRKIYKSATTMGYADFKTGMGAADDPELYAQKAVGGPNELVMLELPKFGSAVSIGGNRLSQRAYIPRWVHDEIQNRLAQDNVITGLARQMLVPFDWTTNTFKWLQTAPWPGFHVRNLFDGMIRTMMSIGLKGLNPTWNYEVLKVARKAKGTVTLGGRVYERQHLYEMFSRAGGKVDFLDKLGTTTIDAVGVADPRLHPMHRNSVFRKAKAGKEVIDTIGGEVDNHFRLSIFLDNLDKGMSINEAMRVAQKYMFDYAHGLAPAERQIMRRIFPFYTFTRFNIPLMLETMYKRPGMLSFMAKTHHILRDDDKGNIEEMIPSYIREQWMLRPSIENGQLRVWAGSGLVAAEDLSFLGDLGRWRSEGPGSVVWQEVIERLNPMFKLPYEYFDGRNLYFGQDILDDKKLTGIVWDSPIMRDFLKMRQVLVDNEVVYRVDGFRWHLLNQTHFARLYRSLAQLRGTQYGVTDETLWERLSPLITGMRVITVDLDRRYNTLNSIAAFNRKEIDKAMQQYDFVKVARILGTLERDEDAKEDVVDAFGRLNELRFQQ